MCCRGSSRGDRTICLVFLDTAVVVSETTAPFCQGYCHSLRAGAAAHNGSRGEGEDQGGEWRAGIILKVPLTITSALIDCFTRFTLFWLIACGSGVCPGCAYQRDRYLSHRSRHHLNGRGAVAFSTSHPPLLLGNRHSGATNQGGQFPESAGFEEATKTGDEYLMLARALLSDRIMLFFPAWVYVACLVLAAALTRVSSEQDYSLAGCLAEALEQAVFFLR